MLTLCVVFKTSAARILKFIILKLSKSDRFLLLFTSVIRLRFFKLPNIGSKKKNMVKVTCKNLQKFQDKIFKRSNGVKKTEESYSWEGMEYY